MRAVGRHSLLSIARWRAVLATALLVPMLIVAGVTPGSAAGSSTPLTSPAWSVGTQLVTPSGGVNVVSCAASTFCVAGDQSGGVSYFNGTTWTAPQTIDATNSITAIDCPTVTFCVATDAIGQHVTMTGTSWSSPTAFGTLHSLQMLSVSCSSPSFCVAVGETTNFTPVDYYFYNGAWTFDSVNLGPTHTSAFDAVSCTPTNVCLATDFGGGVTTFTLTTSPTVSFSHTTVVINPTVTTYIANSISCVSATSCVAGSNVNGVSVFNGTAWSTTTPFPDGANGVLVSCVQTTCFADDSVAQASSSTAPFTSWSSPGTLDLPSQINSFSCYSLATGAACQAVDNDGFSIAITLGVAGVPVYSPSTTVFDPPHTLSSVTCASATYCIAADAAGQTLTYRAGAWSTPTVISTQPLGVREVRCASSTHPYTTLRCAAVVGNYGAESLNSYKAAWLPVAATPPTYAISCSIQCEYLSADGKSSGLVGGYLPKLSANAIATDVSCPTGQSNCFAIDSGGYFYTSRNGQWYDGPRVEKAAGDVLWSLSCTSTRFCVAIDLTGRAYTYNGTKWSGDTMVAALGLYSVSCGATYFCVASDLLGGAYVYNGTKWLPRVVVSKKGVLHGVSCANASSCVAVDSSDAFTLSVPTDTTTISFTPTTRAQNVVGRTVVPVEVSAASAPSGAMTLSVGGASCSATLRKISATTSRAHCSIATSHLGLTRFSAVFSGSYGFAPSGPTYHHVVIVKRA